MARSVHIEVVELMLEVLDEGLNLLLKGCLLHRVVHGVRDERLLDVLRRRSVALFLPPISPAAADQVDEFLRRNVTSTPPTSPTMCHVISPPLDSPRSGYFFHAPPWRIWEGWRICWKPRPLPEIAIRPRPKSLAELSHLIIPAGIDRKAATRVSTRAAPSDCCLLSASRLIEAQFMGGQPAKAQPRPPQL